MTTTRTKRTATQRIEQVVDLVCYPDYVGNPIVPYKDVVGMILAERARLKRGVKKVTGSHMTDAETGEHLVYGKLADVLALWER